MGDRRKQTREATDLALSGQRRNKVPLTVAVAFAFVLTVAVASRASADGAPPGTQAVLLPRERPKEIVLATNFGLVYTEDDGVTWKYTCESDVATVGGYRYILGPPALTSGGISGDRIYGISLNAPGAPVSVDGACTWTLGGGVIADPANPALATDVFPDPANPARVFLIAIPANPADAPGSIYRSLDGGLTYAGPLFTPPDGGRPTLTGVEVSATSPGTVYATWYTRSEDHPHLAVSRDGGDTWTDVPIEAQLGLMKPYLAAVDPVDAETIYLRTGSADGALDRFEGLAISSDGGATWRQPLMIPGGTIQGFVRRQNGELLVLGRTPLMDGLVPRSTLYRSLDGGQTFTGEALPFHGQGLAERGGTLFLPTDNIIDLVALVSSTDGGPWRTRLRMEEIAGVKPCVRETCESSCDYLAGLKVFPPETCHPPDGGVSDASAADAPGERPGAGDGCSCAATGAGGGASTLGGLSKGVGTALAAGLVALWRRRRRSSLPPVRLKPDAQAAENQVE